MSDAGKKRYTEHHKKSMAVYKEAYNSFWSAMSNEEADRLRELIKAFHQKKIEYKNAAKVASDCLPPRRMSGYSLFMKENYDTVRDVDYKERFSLLSKKWKTTSDEVKKAYHERSLKLYDVQMSAYTNMVVVKKKKGDDAVATDLSEEEEEEEK